LGWSLWAYQKIGGDRLMATYVLIHGSEHSSWYWHLVTPRLESLGHEVVAVDLPCDDDSAGLAEYADTVVEAAGDRRGVVLVAHSLGAYTAPLVSERLRASLMVLVAPMVPKPGETANQWWANTGFEFPDPFDPAEVFAHDLPVELAATVRAHLRHQSSTPLDQPWPLASWPPSVPTRAVICREDRFFRAGFLRRVVHERLGTVPYEMDSGHLPALAHPAELVACLEQLRSGGQQAGGAGIVPSAEDAHDHL
jgi:hypothetical protein